jgi:hypothetical protein
VFEEVDFPLHNASRFDDALNAMIGCYMVSSALGIILELEVTIFSSEKVLLSLIGWIHRDTSSGNISRYKNREFLIDLEFAKKLEPDLKGSSDSRLVCVNQILSVTSHLRYSNLYSSLSVTTSSWLSKR